MKSEQKSGRASDLGRLMAPGERWRAQALPPGVRQAGRPLSMRCRAIVHHPELDEGERIGLLDQPRCIRLQVEQQRPGACRLPRGRGDHGSSPPRSIQRRGFFAPNGRPGEGSWEWMVITLFEVQARKRMKAVEAIGWRREDGEEGRSRRGLVSEAADQARPLLRVSTQRQEPLGNGTKWIRVIAGRRCGR